MKYRYIQWSEIKEFVSLVCETLKSKSLNCSGVYGLPRGGLVPAVMISHYMNIPLLAAPTEGCIIVDDICDSGESLLHYKVNSSAIHQPKYVIATICFKHNELVTPDIYLKEVEKDCWIVFPWEPSPEL